MSALDLIWNLNWSKLADGATALGAAAGVLAFGWNVRSEVLGRRRRNASRIQPTLRLGRPMDVLTIDFHGAESHTGYLVTVKCSRPSKLQARTVYPGPDGEQIMGDAQTQPISHRMSRVADRSDLVRAEILIAGHSANQPVRLTFIVREGFGTRVVAKRTLEMIPT